MSPGHKRQVVQSRVARGRCTARAACRHLGLHRSTLRYRARQPDAWLAKLKAALRRLSRAYPAWGYAKITIGQHGAPEYLRSDNGPEFIERKLQAWLARQRIKTIYIDPGSPWQNGYMESFNARLRDECLNREQLWTLTEARVVLEDWRWTYNRVRPHRSLGYITPLEFAQQEAELNASVPDRDSSRPTASLRRSLELLYHLEQLIHPARLTQVLGQIE